MIDRIAEMQAAVDRHLGNKAAAARELGIPRETLRDLLIGRSEKRQAKEETPRRHLVIPDVQAKDGVPLEHLEWVGKYIAEKRPDVIVCIGDFADMPSLSSYDAGKKSFEGRRYTKDVVASIRAMTMLCKPFVNIQGYKPRMVLTIGNHENRIDRAIESDPKIDGLISVDDLEYDSFGWEVVPYLKPIQIDGVAYCHFFTSGVMGRPVSSARALLNTKHQSCVMGHVQKRDINTQYNAFGKRMTAIFSGAYYQHDEDYLGPQGNADTWRGCWMLNEVKDGEFDEMPLSLEYLRRRYAK